MGQWEQLGTDVPDVEEPLTLSQLTHVYNVRPVLIDSLSTKRKLKLKR